MALLCSITAACGKTDQPKHTDYFSYKEKVICDWLTRIIEAVFFYRLDTEKSFFFSRDVIS